MDVLPNKTLRTEDYPCNSCPARSDRACGKCVFASWNVNGILAAFHPKQSYRRINRSDLSPSPLIQNVPRSRVAPFIDNLHPKLGRLVVPSYNRMKMLMDNLR